MWGLYRLPFFLIERLGLRFYRDVVVLNAADEALIRRHSPLAAVRVIPNGIQQRPLDEQLLGRGEHILFLGRIDIWEKGLDLLLAAYQRSGLAMPLLIAGGGTRPATAFRNARRCCRRGGPLVGHVTGAAQAGPARAQRLRRPAVPARDVRPGRAGGHGVRQAGPALRPAHPALDGWRRARPAFDVGAFARAMRDLAGNERPGANSGGSRTRPLSGRARTRRRTAIWPWSGNFSPHRPAVTRRSAGVPCR